MYKCSKCLNSYKFSKENNDTLPEKHVIKCPHCGDESHIIGADEDFYRGEKVYMMYGFNKKDNKDYSHLKVIEGQKQLPKSLA